MLLVRLPYLPKVLEASCPSSPKSEPIRNFMFKHVAMGKECKISTDNDTCFMWMKDYVELENSIVDYQDKNHKMKWLQYCSQQLREQHQEHLQGCMQEGPANAAG